jgi:2-polyprenyl-6-methoxyphenol hydroxylase-like FAD-dependent oxidoreductase
MRHTDIVIAGGGLAGSTAAAMLARDGFDVVLVDPHAVYPPDLRCEKLIGRQVAILRRTGLADLVLRAATLDGGCWVARSGQVVERRAADQYGILYDTLVNCLRGAIPPGTPFICDKVVGVENSASHQVVTLSSGEVILARLVIIANGLNSGLRSDLGMQRDDLSKSHCVTLAFDLRPLGRESFDFAALTYFGERAADRMAYLTLFPVGRVMRANLMAYRHVDDPWLREMRQRPDVGLSSVMPGLHQLIGPSAVAGMVKIRPADVYVTRQYLQPGIVLVGDAFASSCPAAGTGTDKVFTDVERLCNLHVPRWMGTPGMGTDKIAAFYADPVKVDCDRRSLSKAFRARSISIDEGWPWRAQRWARFLAPMAMSAVRGAVLRRGPTGR